MKNYQYFCKWNPVGINIHREYFKVKVTDLSVMPLKYKKTLYSVRNF